MIYYEIDSDEFTANIPSALIHFKLTNLWKSKNNKKANKRQRDNMKSLPKSSLKLINMTIPKYAYVKWLKRRRWHWRRLEARGEGGAWLKGRTKPKRLKHIDNKLTEGQECWRAGLGVGVGRPFQLNMMESVGPSCD